MGHADPWCSFERDVDEHAAAEQEQEENGDSDGGIGKVEHRTEERVVLAAPKR